MITPYWPSKCFEDLSQWYYDKDEFSPPYLEYQKYLKFEHMNYYVF